MAFVAKTNIPLAANNELQIEGYPTVFINKWRTEYKVDDAVSNDRAARYLQEALLYVVAALAVARVDFSQLTNTLYFASAVYNRAKLRELEDYRDIDSTATGTRRANDREQQLDRYQQRVTECISALLQKPRVLVSLI